MNGVKTQDEAIADLRRQLCGVTVAVFFNDGESHVQSDVNADTISFWEAEGIRWLAFEVGPRRFVFPGVRYWTED